MKEMLDKIKYIHIRAHDDGMNLLPNGGATIGFIQEEDKVYFTFVKCNMKDLYNKRIGRLIAKNRLEKDINTKLISIHKEMPLSNVIKCLIDIYYKKEKDFFYDVEKYYFPNTRMRINKNANFSSGQNQTGP